MRIAVRIAVTLLAATGLLADAQERPQPASAPAQTRVGVGQPVAVVAANSDEAVVRVVLRDTDGVPSSKDLSTDCWSRLVNRAWSFGPMSCCSTRSG